MTSSDILKMKFKLHELEFEIEGNQEVVKEQFENFKSFITNDLLPKINIAAAPNIKDAQYDQVKQLLPIQDITGIETTDIPALKEVVLKDLPKSEFDWILIYSFYASGFGVNTFTEENIKKFYAQTGRTNKSRLANLSNNMKSLLNKGFIKVHNDSEYIIKQEGVNYAQDILKGKSSSKKTIKTSKSSNTSKDGSASSNVSIRKNTSSKALSLDRKLNLRPPDKEGLKEFAEKYEMDSSPKQIVVIVYYLKEILELSAVNINHIYTSMDELKIRTPKSLSQLITDTKGRNGWLDYESKEDIKISVQGVNAIKFDLLKSNK
jgi:hypothetical protein